MASSVAERCGRCGGLLLTERCWDGFLVFTICKCVNCGARWDATIQANHQAQPIDDLARIMAVSKERSMARRARSRSRQSPLGETDGPTAIVVHGLPAEFTKDALLTLLRPFHSTNVCALSPAQGGARRYAYAEFQSESSAMQAMRGLDGVVVSGHPLTVYTTLRFVLADGMEA